MDFIVNPSDEAKRFREEAARLDDDGQSDVSASETMTVARAALVESNKQAQIEIAAQIVEMDKKIAQLKYRAAVAKAIAAKLRRSADDLEK